MPFIEEEFTCCGFKCIVLVNYAGLRCGYVAVEKDSSLLGVHYHEIEDNIRVHGGVTFSDWLDQVTWRDEDSNLWAFGFDCGHFNDISAVDDALRYGIISDEMAKVRKQLDSIVVESGSKSFCTQAYAKSETVMLAKQLRRLENEKKN